MNYTFLSGLAWSLVAASSQLRHFRTCRADPETVDDWLAGLGLPQYIPAFHTAGYDDLATLAYLNPTDLNLIEQAAGSAVLPGHRKRLLLAAPQLQGWKPQRRRADAGAAAAGKGGAVLQVEVPPGSDSASTVGASQVSNLAYRASSAIYCFLFLSSATTP